nr:pentatricopeptide repeat-containing protein [Tanacetum cinerariifolium]
MAAPICNDLVFEVNNDGVTGDGMASVDVGGTKEVVAKDVSNDGVDVGGGEEANLDEELRVRKVLDKGKRIMSEEDNPQSKRKSQRKGNGIVIKENHSPSLMDESESETESDFETDNPNHVDAGMDCNMYSESKSDYSDRSVDYLSDGDESESELMLRKIIVLDGCFLKKPNVGEILTAIERDGNNHIFPVAWAVVNGDGMASVDVGGTEEVVAGYVVSNDGVDVGCTEEVIAEDVVSDDGVDVGGGEEANLDKEVRVRKVLDKGKRIMIEEDNPKRKIKSRPMDAGMDCNMYSDSERDYSDRSVDYLGDGEEEVIQVRKRKSEAKTLPKNTPVTKQLVEAKVDKYLMHDEDTHWRMKKPKVGEKYVDVEQLKECLTYYALANGFSLWFYRSETDKLTAKSVQRPEVLKDPSKGKQRSFSKNAKRWALNEGESTIAEHYALLRTYAKVILESNNGSTVKDNHIFSVAWAVVNVENKDNWSWFLQLLGEDLDLSTGNGLTLMSDQHKGLIEAVKDVMPYAEHRQCARHIYEGFRKQFSGAHFRGLLWAASKASYHELFNKIMDKIKRANPNAHQYLIKKDLKTWSRAFFRIRSNCEAVENGFSECFNYVLLRVRNKPLITMLEAMKRLELAKDEQRFWHVIPAGGNLFEVRNGSEAFKVDETFVNVADVEGSDTPKIEVDNVGHVRGSTVVDVRVSGEDNIVQTRREKRVMFIDVGESSVTKVGGSCGDKVVQKRGEKRVKVTREI